VKSRSNLIVVFLLMISLIVPSVSTFAAEYPEGVPAPNRDCGPTAGGTATDSITAKQLICKANGTKNTWQNADGTVVPETTTQVPGGIDPAKEPAPVGENDEQWIAPDPTSANTIGYVANENLFFKSQQSSFASFTQNSSGTITAVELCKDASCAYNSLQRFDAVLPQCGSVASNCISEVFAKDEAGKAVGVKVIGAYPELTPDVFTGNPSINLPSGSVPLLVEIASKPHAGGTTYMVRAVINGFRDKSKNQTKFVIENFVTQIYAVKIVSGKFATNSMSADVTRYNKGERPYENPGSRAAEICAASSDTKCALSYPLPENLSLGVEIKFSEGVSGWLRGRVKKPAVTITGDAATGQTLRMEGFAIHVPSIYKWIPKSPLPASLATFYKDGLPVTGQHFVLSGSDGTKPENMITQYGGAGFKDKYQWDEFLAWLPVVGDKAAVNPTFWNMGTMSNWDDQANKNNPCFESATNLVGIVTTNATQFLEGPPDFIAATGTLDYQVAAPHFTPTGDLFAGTYDLVMSSAVARCLYKFSAAPVKATVSVAGDSASQVVTTFLSESAGWLRLGAYGFSFSSPTIKVKLTQDAAASAPVKATAKKITITCVKGKTVKKVTALKPTCPAGYKRK